jgi:hypothetical protein
MTGSLMKYTCPKCSSTFEAEPVLFGGRDLLPVRHCPPCVDHHEAQQSAGPDLGELESAWQEICPPLYRDTDLRQIPAPLMDAVNGWTGERWLGFAGRPGTRKTRAAFVALRRMHYAGKECHAITGTQLRRLLTDAYADDPSDRAEARATVKRIRTCRFLLLDDLGKQRFTEAAQEDVFDLLETRAAYRRPIIWTTNSGKEALADRLSSDRSSAIIRRLAEFSDITKL